MRQRTVTNVRRVSFCGSETERCGWGKLLTQQQRTSPHIKHQQKRVDSQERRAK